MAVGPYSQAIVSGNLVFTAGEIPIDPQSGNIPETVEGQVELAMKNLMAVLSAAGVSNNHVASVTVHLTDIADFPVMNQIYAKFFQEPFPARTCVEVSALPKGVKIMVSAIGVKD